uniref:cytochrome C n=1 Tax=Candidatus Electronema sp. TaxID=2698783 RepID=UPI0040570A35
MQKNVFKIAAIGCLAFFATAGWAEEVTYRKHIKPIIDAKCLPCHDADAAPVIHEFIEAPDLWMAKGKGMRLDTYSHIVSHVAWPDTGAVMRRLDDGKAADGKQGNMYMYLGATEEERQENLKLFKAWIGNWNLKKWDDVSKEDLNALKLKY